MSWKSGLMEFGSSWSSGVARWQWHNKARFVCTDYGLRQKYIDLYRDSPILKLALIRLRNRKEIRDFVRGL